MRHRAGREKPPDPLLEAEKRGEPTGEEVIRSGQSSPFVGAVVCQQQGCGRDVSVPASVEAETVDTDAANKAKASVLKLELN